MGGGTPQIFLYICSFGGVPPKFGGAPPNEPLQRCVLFQQKTVTRHYTVSRSELWSRNNFAWKYWKWYTRTIQELSEPCNHSVNQTLGKDEEGHPNIQPWVFGEPTSQAEQCGKEPKQRMNISN